jgi:hypothetical protein
VEVSNLFAFTNRVALASDTYNKYIAKIVKIFARFQSWCKAVMVLKDNPNIKMVYNQQQ